MKYLVTGGAGFIGSHLVDKLLGQGHEVVVVDNFSSGKVSNLSKNSSSEKLSIIRRDICSDLSDIFEQKIDAVFHLAANPQVQFSIINPAQTHQVNVNGTFNLLNFCRMNGVRRFVFSSSCSVYGNSTKMPLSEESPADPISPYALHKLIGEQYSKMFNFLYGMETVCLRYFNVYGPRQNPAGGYASLIPRAITRVLGGERPIIFGDGEQTRDFISVHDVVEANILASLTSNPSCFGNTFNIGSSKNTSVNYVVNKIISLSGKGISPVHADPVIEPRHSLAMTKKASSLLGWSPKKSFDDALIETFSFFKN
jgi:UDP-glucose 4-epimerase